MRSRPRETSSSRQRSSGVQIVEPVRVALIEPSMLEPVHRRIPVSAELEPLTLAVLAALTPPDVEVEALDDRIEPIDYDAPRDLVGISVKTYTARRAYQIAAEFRRRGVRAILGGHHPTLLPDEALKHADAVLCGEAEGVWPEVIRDARAGQLKAIYRQSQALPFEDVRVDRSVFTGKPYLPVASIETTRGCPFACNFCSVTKFFGRSFRHRPPSEVVAEIERIGKRFIFFVDDNIVADRRAAKELFRALAPLKIHWISQASLTMVKDLELMRLMRDSGCLGVLVGIESISKANLAQVNKRWNTVGMGYDNALEIIRDHGIAVVGSFMLGMDEDTHETLEATLEFAIEQRFFDAHFSVLTPFPATELYDELVRDGRMVMPEWWLDPRFTYGAAVFEPRRMSRYALEDARLRMIRAFHGPRSIAHRMFERRANARSVWRMLTFLGINVPAYPEERRRQGQPLGAR